MNIAKECFLCFNNRNGKEFLKYLENITLYRSVPHSATDSELRMLEGQRTLVLMIKRMIDSHKEGGKMIKKLDL
ncbi:MAG: hypothetical protein JJV93_02670 [Alphaproteobacteria bacterium]|nr:hypothetical protein [Alphaproteobacteria bacterium]MBL0718133.1 hypothetical protein [Alphaproteobacteria bacterium]